MPIEFHDAHPFLTAGLWGQGIQLRMYRLERTRRCKRCQSRHAVQAVRERRAAGNPISNLRLSHFFDSIPG